MSNNENIRQAIKRMSANEDAEFYGVPCIVESIDENALICDCMPINGDAAFNDVRLQAGAGTGIVIIPKVQSVVMVQPINEITGYISLFSDIESIQFLNGSFGGLIKIEELTTKLNNVEKDLNDLKEVFSTTWTPTPNDGGAALKVAAANWYAATIAETERGDLENELIKHGDI